MKFWRLVSSLFRPARDGNEEVRRLAGPDRLHGMDEFADETAISTATPAVPPEAHLAEVRRVAIERRLRQNEQSRSQFRRLSVIIVDYLLETDWVWLLTGRRRTVTHSKPPNSPENSERYLTTSNKPPADEETSRTLCISESEWSIMSTTNPLPPPDPDRDAS